MSSERSPYREAGISGRTAHNQTKRKAHKLGFQWTGWSGIKTGHVWPPNKWSAAETRNCRRCGQPWFTVALDKCLGIE